MTLEHTSRDVLRQLRAKVSEGAFFPPWLYSLSSKIIEILEYVETGAVDVSLQQYNDGLLLTHTCISARIVLVKYSLVHVV